MKKATQKYSIKSRPNKPINIRVTPLKAFWSGVNVVLSELWWGLSHHFSFFINNAVMPVLVARNHERPALCSKFCNLQVLPKDEQTVPKSQPSLLNGNEGSRMFSYHATNLFCNTQFHNR